MRTSLDNSIKIINNKEKWVLAGEFRAENILVE